MMVMMVMIMMMMPYGWVVTDWVIACIYVCPFMIISVQSGNPWGYAELSAIEPRNLHWQTQRPPKSGDQNILFQTGCTLGKSFFFFNIPKYSPNKNAVISLPKKSNPSFSGWMMNWISPRKWWGLRGLSSDTVDPSWGSLPQGMNLFWTGCRMLQTRKMICWLMWLCMCHAL